MYHCKKDSLRFIFAGVAHNLQLIWEGIIFLFLLFGLIFVPFEHKALAQTNVCAQLAREIFLPYQECVTQDARCFLMPQCCLPGACLVDPICKSWAIVEKLHKVEAGEFYCNFTPDELFSQLLAHNVLNAGDLITCVSPETCGLLTKILALLDAHTQQLAWRGQPFPGHIKQVLRELIAPLYDEGQTGYSYGDIDRVSILTNAVSDASPYFMGNSSTLAVTLGSAIIFRDDLFQQLINNSYTLDEIQKGYAPKEYTKAIETAAHELVHVAQFRRYGSDTFRTNYVLDILAKGGVSEGYERSIYEKEAYGFSARQSLHHGGWYCEDNKDHHRSKIDTYKINLAYDTCKPLYYGNQPVGKCALAAQWADGSTKLPIQSGSKCRVEFAPTNSSPFVWRHVYYIKADKKLVCKPNRSFRMLPGTGGNPGIPGGGLNNCTVSISCKLGKYDGANCYIGTAPDGTRAGVDNNQFVYFEIASSPPPPPPPPP